MITKLGGIAMLSAVMTTSLSAFNIVVDFDTHASNFFSNSTADGQTARATVAAAAARVSEVITTELAAVTSYQYIAEVDGARVELNSRLTYINPTLGGGVRFDDFVGENEFRLFVGSNPALASGTLGVNYSLNEVDGDRGFLPGGSAAFSNLGAAGEAAAALATAGLSRGSMYTTTTTASLGGFSYSHEYGPIVSSISFNETTNWHLDVNDTDIIGFDLYSVAMHEILHAIGVDHLDAILSPLSTEPSMSQVPLMSASLSPNERRDFTDSDVTEIHSIGYSTSFAAVPEPTSSSLLALGGLSLLLRRKK